MERTRELTTFAIDGYQISATFADSRNTTALGHVKQILLSCRASRASSRRTTAGRVRRSLWTTARC